METEVAASENIAKNLDEGGVVLEMGVAAAEFNIYQCEGLHYFQDFPTVPYPPGYDFSWNYPFSIHSNYVAGLFSDSPRHIKPTWNVTVLGTISSASHNKSFMKKVIQSMEGTTFVRPLCADCVALMYHQPLLKTLKISATKQYGDNTPKSLLPISAITHDFASLHDDHRSLKLQSFNDRRKIACLTDRHNDHGQFVTIVSEADVPYMGSLLATHLRQGCSLDGFIEKMERAGSYTEDCYGSHHRQLIQRRRRSSNTLAGDFNDDYKFLRKVDMSFLMLKLGGRRLAKTHNVGQGGFNARHTQRLIQSGVIPVYKVIMSPNYLDMGRIAIRKNMEALKSDAYKKFRPAHRVMSVIMIDGIAVEERVGVDTSVIPNVFTGLCRHGKRKTSATPRRMALNCRMIFFMEKFTLHAR